MAPSLNAHPSFTRPRTGDREGRPATRDQSDNNLIIPSRTSSLHSRITQPIPSTLNAKPQQRTPKTLTHAYMVCGVGREPSQWVKAPPPAQGKIGHMKGAVGQFWLPEILGSSPRLEQDNEIARSLHAAMRVSRLELPVARLNLSFLAFVWQLWSVITGADNRPRLASPTMSRFAPDEANPIASIMHSCFSRILPTHSMAFACASGLAPMRSEPRRFAI